MLPLMFLLVSGSLQTTLAQCLTGQDNRISHNPTALQDLQRSRLDFSLALLKTVSDQQPSENIFISPLSVFNAMLLAYFAAEAQTETSLHNALYLSRNQDKIDMLLAYRTQKALSTSGAYMSQVNSANRLFISDQQTVRDCMTEYFQDEIEVVDFTPKGLGRAVDAINSWVATQTRDNIQNLVSPGSINPGAQLILANAAYFKGVWKTQFNKRDTRLTPFYVNKDKTVSVPMMFQLNTFNSFRSDQLRADVLELPYKGGEISLLLLLPDPNNETRPVASLLQRMTSDSLLATIRQATDANNADKMEVRLPKFNVEKTLELTPILERMGVGDLFRPSANLTGLTGGPRVRLNSAIHKAKVTVDEYGTEAAAATALIDTRIPGGTFTCDRPFLYLLYDNRRNTLLFAGVLNDPSQ